MATRGASDRWEACQYVVASLRKHKRRLGRILGRELREPLAAAGIEIDLGDLIGVLADHLEAQGKAMIADDRAHIAEIGDDPKYREIRDEARDELASKYVKQRDIFTKAYGEARAREVGFESNVDYDPDRLVLQVEQVKELMVSPAVELSTKPVKGLAFDLTEFVEGFEPELGNLRAANDELKQEWREAEEKLIAKQRSMKSYDGWFTATAEVGAALMTVAGMEEEARRLRPSLRRPGRRAKEAEKERRAAAEAATPPAAEPSAETPASPPAAAEASGEPQEVPPPADSTADTGPTP